MKNNRIKVNYRVVKGQRVRNLSRNKGKNGTFRLVNNSRQTKMVNVETSRSDRGEVKEDI